VDDARLASAASPTVRAGARRRGCAARPGAVDRRARRGPAQIARDALDPPSDAFVSGAYRRHVAGVLGRRALTRAVERARR